MNRISRFIMLICIYASLFIGCFSILTYYNEVYLLENPVYQLVLAIVAIVIGLVLIAVQFFAKKEDSIDNDVEDEEFTDEEIDELLLLEDEEELNYLEQEIIDDNYEFVDSNEIEFSKKTEEEIIVDEEKPKDVIEVLHDTLSMKKIEEDQNDETIVVEEIKIENEDDKTEEKSDEKEEVHLNEVKKDILTEEVLPAAELTDTQMMYIENSESSYLNTQGLPQLVITNKVDSKYLKRANEIYKESEKREIVDQLAIEKEELEYLKEVKEESIISILSKISIILALLNIAVLVYYFYTRVWS
ncbi:MAG: hypothetical protein GX914_00440 [Erysipelotrichia bacterium]|nr:hypothetical protein [Erysipelotrichia bacterium]